MRDRLIHGYFAVDYGIVWDAITTKVPELREAVDQLLQVETRPDAREQTGSESCFNPQ